MRTVPGQERQLDAGLADGQVGRLALVLDLDDVHALLGQQRQELRQLARPVGDAGPDDEVAVGDGEAVAHHRDEEGGVDVPAGEHRHRRPAASDLAREKRRDADGARALDDELRPLEEEHDGLADLLVGHRDDVVEHAVEDACRQLAGLLHGDAVGDREAGAARQKSLGPHTDDAHGRSRGAQRERDARGEPAAADRNEDRLEVRHLVDELDRPLARDHERLLERVDEGRAVLRHVRARDGQRLLERRPGELDLGAVVPGRVDLRHRRVLRHEDARPRPDLARGPRDRLAVVAGARRDDARRAFLGAQRRDAVEGTAHLERAGALEILGLEVDLAADEARQRLGAVDRRDARDVLEPRACLLDLR